MSKKILKENPDHYTLKFRAINRDTFNAIRKGTKKVETRAATVKYGAIKKGDIITFSCGTSKFHRIVKSVKRYKSIQSLLRDYKPHEVDPKVITKEELTHIYYGYPGYKQKIADFGLIALTLE
jgi:ASC-1-like (ASCH) protein